MPRSAACRPQTSSSSVVLPQPLGPTTATISPAATCSETSSSAASGGLAAPGKGAAHPTRWISRSAVPWSKTCRGSTREPRSSVCIAPSAGITPQVRRVRRRVGRLSQPASASPPVVASGDLMLSGRRRPGRLLEPVRRVGVVVVAGGLPLARSSGRARPPRAGRQVRVQAQHGDAAIARVLLERAEHDPPPDPEAPRLRRDPQPLDLCVAVISKGRAPPQPIGSPRRRATSSTSPRRVVELGRLVGEAAGRGRSHSRSARELGEVRAQADRAASPCASSTAISTSPAVSSRSTTPIASTRRSRWARSRGSSSERARSSLRRSSSARSARPASVRRTARTRRSAGSASRRRARHARASATSRLR